MPNNVTSYYNYDAAGQVQSILHAGSGGLLQSLYYTYDDDGRRTKIVREDGTSIYYRYDAAGRLAGEEWLAAGGSGLYAFDCAFDAAGNRLKKTFNGETTYYSYNNLNQLTTDAILDGDATYYIWTTDGALASRHDGDGWTYFTWDVDEGLTRIQAPGVTLDNKYNAQMQRVWRSENGSTEALIYDDQKLIAEVATGGLGRYYLSEGGSAYSLLVSQLGPQRWQLFDALGTVIGLTAGDGSLSDTFLYEAFGTSLGRTGTTETPYQYVGGYGYFTEPAPDLVLLWDRWDGRQHRHHDGMTDESCLGGSFPGPIESDSPYAEALSHLPVTALISSTWYQTSIGRSVSRVKYARSRGAGSPYAVAGAGAPRLGPGGGGIPRDPLILKAMLFKCPPPPKWARCGGGIAHFWWCRACSKACASDINIFDVEHDVANALAVCFGRELLCRGASGWKY